MENNQTNLPSVVLVHGFGEDSSIFSEQTKALAGRCTLFTPDLPGSGIYKDYQWQPETDTIEWMADWLRNWMIEKTKAPIILLGHSMGGYITLAFVEKYPELIIGFGLLHSTAFADAAERKLIREKAILFMQQKGGFTFLKTSIPGLFGVSYAERAPEKIAELVASAHQFSVETLEAYYRAMLKRPDRTHVLSASKVPVLIIAGTEDNAAPLKDLTEQAALPANTMFCLLENVGHMGMIESPEQFNQGIIDFIALVEKMKAS